MLSLSRSPNGHGPRLLLLLTLMAGPLRKAHALTQTFCSSENTGADYSAVTDIYQSNGLCQTECSKDYAFAVVQWQQCWCSNYAPADQVDVSQCSQKCPGFPSENCGNADQGLFGYVQLNIAPSGTQGGSGASISTSSSAQPSSTEQSSTTSTTPSSTPSSTTSSSTPPSSTAYTQAAAVTSSSSDTATSALSHTTFVSTRVVTLAGAPVTQTVTSTAVVTPGAANASGKQSENKGISGGTVAGAVVGSIVGVALVLAGIFLLWRRRRSDPSDPESSRARKMERNTSVLSKTGLLSSPMNNTDGEKFPDGTMAFGHRRNTSGSTGPKPVSPGDSDRRNSRPLIYDQRLNPAAIMEHWESNGSRASIGTMQDQRDYSRPLGVTNPDPHGDN